MDIPAGRGRVRIAAMCTVDLADPQVFSAVQAGPVVAQAAADASGGPAYVALLPEADPDDPLAHAMARALRDAGSAVAGFLVVFSRPETPADPTATLTYVYRVVRDALDAASGGLAGHSSSIVAVPATFVTHIAMARRQAWKAEPAC